MRQSFIIASLALIMLSGCGGRTELSDLPPPPDMQPALLQEIPKAPVRVLEIPVALPLPGQLMEISAKKPKGKTRSAKAAVDAANRAAHKKPGKDGYVNAVQIYPYVEGALYQLYAAPERVSDIALQPGENLVSVAAGDTVRWIVGDTTSGAGTDRRTHILVKPAAAGIKTNLIITTDRRSYHLQMESTSALPWQLCHGPIRQMNLSPSSAPQRPWMRARQLQRAWISTGSISVMPFPATTPPGVRSVYLMMAPRSSSPFQRPSPMMRLRPCL